MKKEFSTSTPLLSVCVAICNVSKYLGECLSSLINFDEKAVEFILVNDGSTDNSAEICSKYLSSDERFRIFHHPFNKSLIQARKTGIKNARGKYVCFLDGDDKIFPENLKKLFLELKNNEADVIQFEVSCFGEVVYKPQTYDEHFRIKTGVNELALSTVRQEIFKRHSIPWCLTNKAYKTDVLKKAIPLIGDLRLTSGEDAYLSFMITHIAHSYSFFRSPVYCYRIGSGISKGVETIEKFSIHVRDNRIPNLLTEKILEQGALDPDYISLAYLGKSLKELTIKRFWMLSAKDKIKGLTLLFQEKISAFDLFKTSVLIFLKFSSRAILPRGTRSREIVKEILYKLS